MSDNSLGQYLRTLRKHHGYSQEFVASHLNIIRQTYSHYETGRIMPPADSLYNLSMLYHIPVESLLMLSIHYKIDTPALPEETADSPAYELSFLNSAVNAPSPYQDLDSLESELLNYFRLLDDRDKEDILENAKAKSRRNYKDNKKS